MARRGIAVWTGPDLGGQLLGRVVEHELTARLPNWRVIVAEPAGAAHLARAAILNVVCAGPAPDVPDPVVLCGVRGDVSAELAARATLAAVRDQETAARLDPPVNVVPHPGLLAARLVDPDSVPVRVRHLRRLGVLPARGAYVVESATLPADLALEDRLAALAGSRLVIATDEHHAVAAAGLGAAWVLVDPAGEHRAAAVEFGRPERILDARPDPADAWASAEPAPVAALARLAEHFDQIAALAGQLAVGADAVRDRALLAADNAATRRAYQRQRQRILLERERLVEPLIEIWGERDAVLAELRAARAENEVLAARAAQLEREMREWQHTKLVRWTRPLRGLYARLRAR